MPVPLLAAALATVVVVPAPLDGEPPDAELARTLADALGAPPPGALAQAVHARNPDVVVPAHADELAAAAGAVDAGCAAYARRDWDAAVAALGPARDVLRRDGAAVADDGAIDRLYRAHFCYALAVGRRDRFESPTGVEAMDEAVRFFPPLANLSQFNVAPMRLLQFGLVDAGWIETSRKRLGAPSAELVVRRAAR
jgi:hypothetical protein